MEKVDWVSDKTAKSLGIENCVLFQWAVTLGPLTSSKKQDQGVAFHSKHIGVHNLPYRVKHHEGLDSGRRQVFRGRVKN